MKDSERKEELARKGMELVQNLADRKRLEQLQAIIRKIAQDDPAQALHVLKLWLAEAEEE